MINKDGLDLIFSKVNSFKPLHRNAILILLGVFGTLAMPPFYLFFLLIPAFTLLFSFGFTSNSWKRSFKDGWFFGMGYFVTGIYWFAHALLIDAEAFGWLIPFAIFGIGGILSIYSALSQMLFSLFVLKVSKNKIASWLAFAASFSIMEFLRAHLFSGFPWNLIGYSWTITDVAIQGGWYLGIYFLGTVTILLASLPVLLMGQSGRIEKIVYSFSLILAVGFFALCYSRIAIGSGLDNYGAKETLRIRMVQGNIPQTLKWDPAGKIEAIKTYANLTVQEGHEDVDLVIWPESAMPFPFSSRDEWAKRLADLVPSNGYLITGVIRVEPGDIQPTLFNSIQVLDKHADVISSYDKRKLVPFGEFIPLRGIIPMEKKLTHGMLDFTKGKDDGVVNISPFPPLMVIICYEAIFPELLTNENGKALWILNVTNDAWFGNSTAPYQHLQMSRMRAVEAGVPMIRAANSGISAAFDHYGRLIGKMDLNERGYMDVNIIINKY